MKFSTGMVEAQANAGGMKSTLDSGIIYIYSGSQPTDADNAATGTLLALITLNGDAFTHGSPANGLVFENPGGGVCRKPAAAVWRGVGIAAGQAAWFRFSGNALDNQGSSTTLPRIDGTIGTSGADLIVSTRSVAVGVPLSVDVFAVTFPKSA